MQKIKAQADYVGDVTYVDEESTLATIDRHARICYRSEPVVSPLKFVRSLKKRAHWSTLEHSQLAINVDQPEDLLRQLLPSGKYRFFDLEHLSDGWIGGSLRSWVETYNVARVRRPDVFGQIKGMMPELLGDWDVPCIEPRRRDVPNSLRRHAVYMVVDRGIMAEVTRHDMSFLVESTRYVVLSGRMEFIDVAGTIAVGTPAYEIWNRSCQQAEESYTELLGHVRPELARQVLNMSLATRMYIVGLPSYWNHFFSLRRSPKAHPLVREACELLYPQMSHLLDAGGEATI